MHHHPCVSPSPLLGSIHRHSFSWGPHCCDKHSDQNQIKEEKAYSILHPLGHTLFLKELRSGIQDRSLEAGADEEAMEAGAAYWVAYHGLLSFLSYSIQDH